MSDVIIVGADHGRIAAIRLALACEALASRTIAAPPAQMPGEGALDECIEHGRLEQGRPVRRILSELPQRWRADEDARYHKTYRRPTEVYAMARRCCTLAGCRDGACLACLATRQRHRPRYNVPRPGDLVLHPTGPLIVWDGAGMDWTRCWWAKPQMDRVRFPGPSIPQASNR